MSSLIQVRSEVTPKDPLMSTQKLLNMAIKRSDAKFTNTDNRVGTLFQKDTYLYQLNNDIDAYKYTETFTVCFWAKFKDLGHTDEAFGNKIILILNDGTTISADIPSNVNMTNYHWVKIQRDTSDVITIYLDNTAIETQTSNAVFSLADNSYIFMGNTNRYFTGYDVIVDDILIFGGIVDATDTTPIDYLNPASFTMLLYIKVSDGSVWGYADDGGGGVTDCISLNRFDNTMTSSVTGGLDFSASDSGRFSTGIDGQCCSFDSTNWASDTSSGIKLADYNEWTIEMWFKSSGFINDKIVFCAYYPTIDRISIGLCLNSPHHLQIDFIPNDGSSRVTENVDIGSSGILEDGNWHHIAICYDGTNMKMYFDGVQKWTKVTATPLYQSDIPITWQINRWGASSIMFGGTYYLDNLAMYSICKYTSDFTPSTIIP